MLSISAGALAQENAAPTVERVQIVHQASSACPAGEAFVREVAMRVQRPVEWVHERATTSVRVELVASNQAFIGRLELLRSGSAPAQREIEAETCAEVSSALALILALALDPNARTEPLPSVEAPPKPAEIAPPTAAPPAPRPRAAASDWRLHFGPAAGISSGYVPTRLVTVGAVVGVRWTAKQWFAPLVRLVPLWGKTGTTGPELADATFTWALLRLDACPTRLPLGSVFSLMPCVSVEGGRVAARGRSGRVDVAVSEARPWTALGPTLGLRLASGTWFAALSVSALATLVRDEFVFLEPLQPIHEVPPVVFGSLFSFGLER